MINRIELWQALLAAPCLFWVPGYAVVRLLEVRRRSDLTFSESFFMAVGMSVTLTAFLGLVLAMCGAFSILALVLLELAIAAVLLGFIWSRERLVWKQRRPESGWWMAALVLLIVLASLLCMRGFQYVVTVREPARYLTWGTTIAGTGGLHVYNSEIPELTDEQFRFLYGTPKRNGAAVQAGWVVKDVRTGEMNVDYFPLYGVLVAVSLKLVGMGATLTVMNSLLFILGLLALVLLVRRLLDRRQALVVGLLLAVLAVSVYFARYVSPEIFTLFLLMLGLLQFDCFLRTGRGPWGLAAASTLSLTFLARFDLYVVLVPVLLVAAFIAAVRIARRQRAASLLWFILPFPAMFLLALFSQWKYSYDYLVTQYRYVMLGGKVGMTLAACALALAAAFLIICGYLYRRYSGTPALRWWLAVARRWWRPALGLLLALLFLLLYFVVTVSHQDVSTEGLRLVDPLKQLFFYLTPVALALWIIGLFLFVDRKLSLHNLMFFSVGLFYTALYAYNPYNPPIHIWLMRRYIIVVIPFVLVLAVYAAFKLPRFLRARWLYAAGAAALVALLVLFSLYSSLIVGEVEYRGALPFFEQLQTGVGLPAGPSERLFEGKLAVRYFPLSARHVFGVRAFPVQGAEGAGDAAGQLAARWNADGRTVVLYSSDSAILPRLWHGAWTVLSRSERLSFEELPGTVGAKPTTVIHEGVLLNVYRLSGAVPAAYQVKMWLPESWQVVEGWYAPTLFQGQGARWSGQNARLVLPVLPGQQPMTVRLSVSLGGRSVADGGLPVEVTVDGRPLTVLSVRGAGFGDYEVMVARDAMADPGESNLVLGLKTTTWVPPDNKGRPAGVLVRECTVEPAR